MRKHPVFCKDFSVFGCIKGREHLLNTFLTIALVLWTVVCYSKYNKKFKEEETP